MKILNNLVLAGAVACTSVLTGCSTQNIDMYQNVQPTLNMNEFFDGQIEGWGMFQSRSGEVKRRFYVDIQATKEGDLIVLDESFDWADGTKSKRVWRLTEQPDGSWRGTAGDVVGEAIGNVAGNSLHWKYVLKLPVDDKEYEVVFDDWMYLVDENVMLNRSIMKKFGVELGSVTLTLQKVN